ncbi:hypothetical protein [Candidatus Aquarickettsia rohweri]|nr:hypothetical protein [Candidatus Aquarickettsia rohweri]
MPRCPYFSAYRFINPPKDSSKNYGNRLKVEETFSRYKRIVGNKVLIKHI